MSLGIVRYRLVSMIDPETTYFDLIFGLTIVSFWVMAMAKELSYRYSIKLWGARVPDPLSGAAGG
jgi:hypothetical protein